MTSRGPLAIHSVNDPTPHLPNEQLTGGFRELVLLFLPISLMTFSTCLFLLVEKLFLARLSTVAMEAALSAAYACQIFQAPCIALAMMAQVFIGRWKGAEGFKEMGPCIWQFIWFSLLSMLITLPCGVIYGNYYFEGTEIQDIVLPYYHFYLGMNFLFPLGTTLTCFFLGQGKTRLILFSTLAAQGVKILLTYLFIFGVAGVIPAWGILGGVFSTLVAQGGFCALLLAVFLSPGHREKFQSGNFSLNLPLFWEYVRPGLLRAGNRILNFTCWASIAYLMSNKGDDYLLILSVGGVLFLFLPFITEAICQAQVTMVSQILGTRNLPLLGKALRSGFFLSLVTVALAAIPLVFFPIQTFHWILPETVMEESVILKVFLGVWMCFVCFNLSSIPVSYVLAFKDTQYSLFMGMVGWVNGFLLMYLALNIMHFAPEYFWLTLSLMHASNALLYYWRMRWLLNKEFALYQMST